MKDIVLYIVCGLAGGALGGMGMGGGTLLIPLLGLFCGVSQHAAQAINLISFIPCSIVAIAIHAKNKLIKFKEVFPIIPCGILFSLVGSIIGKQICGAVLKRIFGGFLIVLSFVCCFSDKIAEWFQKRKSEKTNEKN